MGDRAHDEPASAQPAPDPQRALVRGALGDHVLRLQRTAGNRAVRRILARQPAATANAGSKLVGLKAKLDWKDFTGTPPASTPFFAATQIVVERKVDGQDFGSASFESRDGAFALKNSVVVTVKLGSKSWKKIDGLTSTEAQLLLEHEQAHFDISALVMRDMFIAIMALKTQTFATAQDGANALVTIANRYSATMTTIDKLYDSTGETGHRAFEKLSFGPTRKPLEQSRWEGFLSQARTTERAPLVEAPDGATYKLELADILRSHGHTI